VIDTTWRQPEAIGFTIFAVVVVSVGVVALSARDRRLRMLGLTGIISPLLILAFTSGLVTGLGVAVLLALLAWLVGVALLTTLHVSVGGSAAHALALGLGSGVIAYSVFGLGLVGLLNGPLMGGTFAALAIASGLLLRRHDIRRLMRWEPITRIDSFMLGAGALAAAGVLPYVYAPEVTYDAVYYHLAMVRGFLEQGSVSQLPNLFASNFPLVPQLVYASAAGLSGELDSAKLVHLFVGLGVALAIFATASQLAGRYAGLVAVTLWLGVPLVLWEMSTAYVDLFSVFYVMLSVLATILWSRQRDPNYALIAGAFFGLGLGIKVSAAFPTVALGGAVLILFIRNRREFATWIGAGATALALGAPWYLRSYLLTGNPVFPFLNSVFRSPQWEPVNENFNFSGFGLGSGPMDLLFLPIRLVTESSRFGEMPDGALGLLPVIGALALAGGMIARDRRYATLALAATGTTVFWFASAQYGRYLLPILAILAALAGALTANLARRAARPVIGALLSLILGLSFVGYLGTVATVPGYVPWKVVLGGQNRGDYLNVALRHYAAYSWMAEHIPPTAQVLGVGYSEWPIVYSDQRIFIGHMTQPGRQILLADSPDEARHMLESGNFGYVIIDFFPRPTLWRSSIPIATETFIEKSLRLIYANNYVYVYQIAPPFGSGVELLRDPELDELGKVPSWQPFGTLPTDATECRGAWISSAGGYVQTFDARPETLYVVRSALRARSSETNGKLQINWIRNDGSTQTNIEIFPITSSSELYAMASTSPDDVKQGVVYLSGYGTAGVCVERASVASVP